MISTKECCPSRFRTRDLLKLSEKKSACKINENDLKIAWNALSGTLRQSSFKNFPGEAPGPPYKRGTPLILSPSRGLRRLIHAFGSQCTPPPSSDLLGPALL